MKNFLCFVAIIAASSLIVSCEKKTENIELNSEKQLEVDEKWSLYNCISLEGTTMTGWGIYCDIGLEDECPIPLPCTIIIDYQNPAPDDSTFLEDLAAAYGYSVDDLALFKHHLETDSVDLGSDSLGMALIFERLND